MKKSRKTIITILMIISIMFAIGTTTKVQGNGSTGGGGTFNSGTSSNQGAGRNQVQSGGTTSGNTGTSSEFGNLGDIYHHGDDKVYNTVGGRIIGLVSYICYAAAIIILIYKGVGLMYKAPEAKADAKKELVSYAIGAFILFGVGAMVRLIGNIALNNLFQ